MSDKIKSLINSLLIKECEKNGSKVEEILDGASQLNNLRKSLNEKMISLKREMINNHMQILHQKIMDDDLDGVIEILDNSTSPIGLFNVSDKLNELVNVYGKYDLEYQENYPEIKYINERLAIKEKNLLPLLVEIKNDNNEVVGNL